MLEEPIEEKYFKNTYIEIIKEVEELRRENNRLIQLCKTRFEIIDNLELRIAELKDDNKRLRAYLSKRGIVNESRI